jgi:hypothetical protein
MPKTVEVHFSEKISSGSHTRRELNLEYFDGKRLVSKKDCFFDIEFEGIKEADILDFAALSVLFGAMRWKRSIRIHGPVSVELIQNLEEFQNVFISWFPAVYGQVEVTADREVEDRRAERGDRAVTAFSGGVDAAFTLWRHVAKKPGRFHKSIRTAVLVQGWDIPLGQDEAFARALERNQRMLSNTGVNTARVKTNVSKFLPAWEQNFGAALGAVLHQFSADHDCGLIGSDEPYSDLALPWGSNPISNHLLSSGAFQIITDGSSFTRTEKVKHILDWPEAMENLRVCWEGPGAGANCCRCEKCIRTILNFRALGVPRPGAFPDDVSDGQIRSMRRLNAVQRVYMKDILRIAAANKVQGSWVAEVEQVLKK